MVDPKPSMACELRGARFPWIFWLACATYLALRARILFANFDAVAIPNYEVALMGNIARLATSSDGSVGPVLAQYYDNCGGHLVTGLLAIPGYAVFGASYLSLKLVVLLLGLGTLALLWRIAERLFGRKAASVAIFLFALTPPTLVKFSLLAQGNHFENLFFQLLAWALFLRAQAQPDHPRRLFVFGLAAGFSIFFYFGAILLVAILCAMQLGTRGLRAGLRDGRPIAAGMIVGLAPLAWVDWQSGGRALRFLSAKLGQDPIAASGAGDPRPWAHAFERIELLWTQVLPRAGVFEDLGPIRGAWAETLLFCCFLFAWVCVSLAVLRAWRRPAAASSELDLRQATPLVLYLPLFTLLFAVSKFDFDTYPAPVAIGKFRYLVPHFLFAAILIGGASALLARGGGIARRVGQLLAGCALATGLCTLPIASVPAAAAGAGAAYPGYDYGFLANLLVRDAGAGEPLPTREIAAQLERLREVARAETSFGVGFRLADRELWPLAGGAGDPRRLPRRLDDLAANSPALRLDLARGVGAALRRRGTLNPAAREELRRRLLEDLDPEDPDSASVVEGLALEYGLRLQRSTRADLRSSREIAAMLPEHFAAAFARGRGLHAGRLCARGIAADFALLREDLPEASRLHPREYWFGFGFGVADRTQALDARVATLVESPGAAEWSAILASGIGAGLRHVHGFDAGRERGRELRARLPAAWADALDRGLAWPQYPAPFVP